MTFNPADTQVDIPVDSTLLELTSSRRPAKTHIHLRSPLQVSCNGLMV